MACNLLFADVHSSRATATNFRPTPPTQEASRASIGSATRRTRICFVGLNTLAVLAPEYDRSGPSGEPVQHALLAKSLARRGARCLAFIERCYGEDATLQQYLQVLDPATGVCDT